MDFRRWSRVALWDNGQGRGGHVGDVILAGRSLIEGIRRWDKEGEFRSDRH